MDLRDIVKKLRNEGYAVGYRARKDGSIVITSIDGRKFTAKSREGNKQARMLAGVSLSQAQVKQRKQASVSFRKAESKKLFYELKRRGVDVEGLMQKTSEGILTREALKGIVKIKPSPKAPSVTIPKNIRNLISQANRALSKTKVKWRVSVRKIKQAYRRGASWGEIARSLKESVSYAKGKAYAAEIDWLISHLRAMNYGGLALIVEANRSKFTEEDAKKMREIIYHNRTGKSDFEEKLLGFLASKLGWSPSEVDKKYRSFEKKAFREA